MTEVIMPKMGDGMEEGTLLEWLKAEGDKVKTGEAIAMIQTDKASLEMEATGNGTLAGILVQVGESVPVGKPVVAILKDGESLPDGWGKNGAAPAASQPAEAAKTEAKPADAAPAASAAPTSPTPTLTAVETAPVAATAAAGSTRVKASPLAKKIAAESGIDLQNVSGTGPGGRITEKDVRTASSNGAAKPTMQVAAQLESDRTVPLNKIRQITAKRTTESKQTVPHFYVTVEVDLESIVEMREMFAKDGDFKPSFNDFIVKAVALALREMPVVNSTYQGDHLLEFGAVNIGMAVALDDGLTVPVVHHADQLSLRQISAKAKELATKARDNKLGMDDITGSTFSISNMGMLNVYDFGAIINQPNAGIVAVSSARKVVCATENDDEIEVRQKMYMTGSFDHRVVDGAVGAKFMNVIREFLEKPTRLLS